jgi:tetratricopeptide (TPR) repeat protein
MPNPQKQFNRALQLHQAGQIHEAIDLYSKALPRMQKNPQLLFLLGTARLQAGEHAACIGLMQRALALEPDNAFAWINRGNALQALQRLQEAVAAFDRALALKPELPEVHNNRGAALLGLGRLDEARAAFDAALALAPAYAEAHNNRGYALKALGEAEEALGAFDRALALKPDYAEAHNNRGAVLLDLGHADTALAAFDAALALAPAYAEAHFNRGNALKAGDRLEAALAAYDAALALGPDAEGYSNRGNVRKELKRLDAALADYDAALALKPDYAEAHNNRGAVFVDLNRLEAALAAYDRALALKPDYVEAHWNKAVLLILQGEYLEGWALYEWRLRREDGRDDYHRFPQPAWRGGEDLRGKRILVHGEQGFGDVVQFCRYLPQLRALGAEIVFEAPRALVPLVATLDCPMTLVAKGDALPAVDVCCPLMSLPHAFATTVETIPAATPYLHADADKLGRWRQALGDTERLRVGLVWSGSTGHKNDAQRSMRLQDLLPLMALPVEWHALQKEYRDHDLELLARHPEIRQHAHALGDFADTAALIACMDLVISVDTGVAHVAGALGKPVWVLLPFAPDYRWLLEREDSPWYPTARLFRQAAIGDWPGVVAALAAALPAFAAA